MDIDNIEQLGYLGLLIAAEKYAAISKLLHGRSEKDCADTMRSFLDSIDRRVRLSDEGFTKEVISWFADNCFKVSEASVKNHPPEFRADTISSLYEKAL